MTSPTAAASTIPALQPLVDNFHPELTPQDKRIATVRVRRAFGYWAGGAHLKIRSSGHGLPKLGVTALTARTVSVSALSSSSSAL